MVSDLEIESNLHNKYIIGAMYMVFAHARGTRCEIGKTFALLGG